jgi:hypothetical protein
MIYSDFYITREFKIEILPTDSINQATDVLNEGDKLVTVYRPVDGEFAVKLFTQFFFDELKQRYEVDTQDINELLFQTISAFGVSLSNPPSDFVPQDKVQLVVVYIKNDEATVAKVGKIAVKKKDEGRFKEIYKENSNPLGPGFDTLILLQSLKI